MSRRSACPASARSAISRRIVESGQYFARPGPSSWSVAPVAAVSACSPASGLRSTWARIDRPWRNPEPSESLDDREAHRPVLRVHAHGRAGPLRALPPPPRTPSLERRQVVIARADLDDPAAPAQLLDEPVGEFVDGRWSEGDRPRCSARPGAGRSRRRRGGPSRATRPRARRGRGRARSASSRRATGRRRRRAWPPPRSPCRRPGTPRRAARACRGTGARARRTGPSSAGSMSPRTVRTIMPPRIARRRSPRHRAERRRDDLDPLQRRDAGPCLERLRAGERRGGRRRPRPRPRRPRGPGTGR